MTTRNTTSTFMIDPRVCRVTGTNIDCQHPACRAQDKLANKQSRPGVSGLRATLEQRITTERSLKTLLGIKAQH